MSVIPKDGLHPRQAIHNNVGYFSEGEGARSEWRPRLRSPVRNWALEGGCCPGNLGIQNRRHQAISRGKLPHISRRASAMSSSVMSMFRPPPNHRRLRRGFGGPFCSMVMEFSGSSAS